MTREWRREGPLYSRHRSNRGPIIALSILFTTGMCSLITWNMPDTAVPVIPSPVPGLETSTNSQATRKTDNAGPSIAEIVSFSVKQDADLREAIIDMDLIDGEQPEFYDCTFGGAANISARVGDSPLNIRKGPTLRSSVVGSFGKEEDFQAPLEITVVRRFSTLEDRWLGWAEGLKLRFAAARRLSVDYLKILDPKPKCQVIPVELPKLGEK